MQSDPEPAPGALAPRAAASSLAEPNATLTGGAGLFDHAARDPFAPSAGLWTGVLGLALTVVVSVFLIRQNPALESGKAGGTPNQLAPLASAAVLTPGSPAAEGARIIATKPCVGCHTIPGIPGATAQVGPNLAGVASRPKIAGGAVPNTGPDDLTRWILNPPAVKPGTAMPNVGLTPDEAAQIVAFLETLT
ncbi:MAG: c-type cytochrome [Chloroflexota bacterium]|nr:c-type cytochrome [Chloroflexota bacterium]